MLKITKYKQGGKKAQYNGRLDNTNINNFNGV